MVTLNSSLGNIEVINQETNKEGKATFVLTSTSAGIAEITAQTGGVVLEKKITVKFE